MDRNTVSYKCGPTVEAIRVDSATSHEVEERFDEQPCHNVALDEKNVRQLGDIEDAVAKEGVDAAAVRKFDGNEPANTLRAWILGFFFVTISSALNMFLSMRDPPVGIPCVVILLLVYPVGCCWARCMPQRRFHAFGMTWSLNSGPFNIKEHTVISLMTRITSGFAYSTAALIALQAKPLYNRDLGWGFSLLFTLSSQLIGIGLAGLFRRFLVWPTALAWPCNFSSTSLLYALHDQSNTDPQSTNGWRISRYRWYFYLSAAAFAYNWFPAVLFQGLSVFSLATWIKPDSVVLNQLFGGKTGLSLIPLTFDWTRVMAFLGDPLLSPTISHVNALIGLAIFLIIPTIGITYSGALFAQYLPINTTTTFDNTQSAYDVHKILGPDFTFDENQYRRYSPMFLPPTLALNYGLSFAAMAAAIVHTLLHRSKQLWTQLRKLSGQEEDIHYAMLKRYRPAPDWWYMILFVASLCLGLGAVLGYPTQLPWWGFLVSCLMALVLVIPSCTIAGITNIGISLNVIGPFVGGYLFPGRPIAVMVFKIYSTIVLAQAERFSGDLKLGLYLKIPPRITFSAQIVAVLWSCIVQVAVMNWTLTHIDGVCDADQINHFTCPIGRNFFSSSITWGVIGPQRMFGTGSIYASINWFWLLGALLPVTFWMLARTTRNIRLQQLHAPIMLGVLGYLPPATPLSFASWAIVGIVFNHCIRRRFHGWWSTYNYLTGAALDSGLVVSTVVIFFAIVLPNVTIPQWWGNVAVYKTKDMLGTAILKIVDVGQTFGPRTW